MKTVILAGGLGTRLAEETEVRPKPMVEIGGQPVLWHIMRYYSHFGLKEFVVALGYKSAMIKRFFLDAVDLGGNLSLDLRTGRVKRRGSQVADWKLHLVETGKDTLTGGRLKRLEPWLRSGTFCMTYGDGLADVDLKRLLQFHRSHGKLATVTVVRPPSRFGTFLFQGDRVKAFEEKPQVGEGWINGGFFVLEPEVLDLIPGDQTSWEQSPMATLAVEGQLMAFRHNSFWQCMDTVRDKKFLEGLWSSGKAPWRVWAE